MHLVGGGCGRSKTTCDDDEGTLGTLRGDGIDIKHELSIFLVMNGYELFRKLAAPQHTRHKCRASLLPELEAEVVKGREEGSHESPTPKPQGEVLVLGVDLLLRRLLARAQAARTAREVKRAGT